MFAFANKERNGVLVRWGKKKKKNQIGLWKEGKKEPNLKGKNKKKKISDERKKMQAKAFHKLLFKMMCGLLHLSRFHILSAVNLKS